MGARHMIAIGALSSWLLGCAGTQPLTAIDDSNPVSAAAPASGTSNINRDNIVEVSARADELSNDDEICQTEQLVGTHVRREICLTRSQRAAIRNQSQRIYREMKGF